ncbi:hypothetical protein VF08_38020, partial [Nostoc linckia z8]
MAVVDDKRGAVVGDQALADRQHDRLAGRRHLEDFAVGGRADALRQHGGIEGGDTQREAELVVFVEADHALVKAIRRLDELPDGDRVEEFVGGEQGEAFGHAV